MQKKLYIVGIIVLLLLNQNIFAHNNIIYITKNQPYFTIKLTSNRTTGYSWSVKYDKHTVSLIKHKYIAPNSRLIGAPGYEQWMFRASSRFLNEGRSIKLAFSYTRPWEQNKSIKTITYRVKIKD